MPIVDSRSGAIRATYTREELVTKAQEMRAWNMVALTCANSGHTGGTLSIMDIAAALYLHVARHDPANPEWEDRDRIIWSAGHKAPAMYVALGVAGYFDDRPVSFNGEPLPGFDDVKGVEQCVLLRRLGSGFEGHPNRLKLPGVELSSGSLGQGFGVAQGCAMDAKLEGRDNRVYVITGDGEHDEGSMWETIMACAHYKLDNLCCIVDRNNLQIDGTTDEVMQIAPLREKYEAFGWHVIEIDGHDMEQILDAFREAETVKGKPTCIIAYTIKGKGVDFCENVCGYHGVPPKDGRDGEESLEACIRCLEVEDEFNDERLDRAFAIVQRYQEAVDARIEATMPRFSRDYWWNSADTMKCAMDATRNGFGWGVAKLSASDQVVAFGADITASIRMDYFYKPDGKTTDVERQKRFFSMGIQEQNMTVAAAGFAKEGKTSFIGSYGVFVTGRNWDQLRTTCAYNRFAVKVADAHGGISVGPDGATHQALEEISVVTCIPGFSMIVPCDSRETERATLAIAEVPGPGVVRFAREATPVCTREDTPFVFGQANVIRFRGEADNFADAFETCLASDYESENEDLAIIACGPMVPEAMRAAYILKLERGIETRILNVHTVKPLDRVAIVAAAADTGVVITAEEHQVGGFGNLVAGAICQGDLSRPVKLRMVGVRDTFGESGQPWELMKFFGLTAEHIAQTALELLP
ncbi:MAG: transketolase [Armatimonadetes bacterium]|nr:transketolase [Armatimonadota bacterium]